MKSRYTIDTNWQSDEPGYFTFDVCPVCGAVVPGDAFDLHGRWHATVTPPQAES